MQLDVEEVVHCYQHAGRRLLVLGYNSTLTTPLEAPRHQAKRTFDQMQVLAAYTSSEGFDFQSVSFHPKSVDFYLRSVDFDSQPDSSTRLPAALLCFKKEDAMPTLTLIHTFRRYNDSLFL